MERGDAPVTFYVSRFSSTNCRPASERKTPGGSSSFRVELQVGEQPIRLVVQAGADEQGFVRRLVVAEPQAPEAVVHDRLAVGELERPLRLPAGVERDDLAAAEVADQNVVGVLAPARGGL